MWYTFALQAAYECLYTLLLTCIERLDVNQFIGLVEEGLRDHHDIMLLTHLMFIRLVAVAHTQVRNWLRWILRWNWDDADSATSHAAY